MSSLEMLNTLRADTKCDDPFKVRKAIFDLYQLHKVFYINITRVEFPFHRGRNLKENKGLRWSNIADMMEPPAESTPTRRFNPKNNPVLYTSSSVYTVLDEIKARDGDTIQIIDFNVKDGEKLHVYCVGELTHVFYTGASHYGDSATQYISKCINDSMVENGKRQDMIRLLTVDKFLSDILTDKNEEYNGYARSSILGEIIFQDSNNYDVVFYPSIKHHGSLNSAFRPSSAVDKLEIQGCYLIYVDKMNDQGFHDFHPIDLPKQYTDNGTIIW